MELQKLLELYLILNKNQREHLWNSTSHQESAILRYVENEIYGHITPQPVSTVGACTATEINTANAQKFQYTGPGIMGRAI